MSTVSLRPWGRFEQFTENENTTIKIITVGSAEKLSVQRHTKRDELWVALDAGFIIHFEKEEQVFHKGTQFFIPRNSIHSIENVGEGPARFLEIAFGHFDEDDIERLEDNYGRC